PGFGEAGFAEEGVVPIRNCAAGVVPAGDVLELDFEDGALEAVKARVPADLIVIVAAAHSVLAQHAGALGDLVVVSGEHAGVSGRAEILGGVKAERGSVTKCSRGFAVRFGTPGLGSVFDQPEAVFGCDPGEGIPVRALPIKVDRQDGFGI